MIERPAAMLVIELQNDLCSPTLTEDDGLRGALARAVARRGVLERLPPLLDACRRGGIPVLYATKERHPAIAQPGNAPIYGSGGADPILVRGSWGARVVDAVAPRDGDLVLPRLASVDPSHGSELWAVCEQMAVRTLIVAGISTTFAVEGTVRGAVNRGYRVVVVEDCCAGVPDEWHRFSVEHIMPLLATVAGAEEVGRAIA